jgi:hypothetical protein
MHKMDQLTFGRMPGREWGSSEDFLTGFATKDGQAWGRPAGLFKFETVEMDEVKVKQDQAGLPSIVLTLSCFLPPSPQNK